MKCLNYEFVFSNQPRRRLARHGVFWLAWAIFFAFIYGFLPFGESLRQGFSWPVSLFRGFSFAFIDAVLFMPTHIFLAYIILYWLIPRFVLKEHYGWALVSMVIAILATGVFSACLTKFVIDPIRVCIVTGMQPSDKSFTFAMMAGLRGATTIGGFAAAIKLVKIWYLKQQAYQQIDREKLQAELQLLKSQVHPHFLFNTLNNLYGLTLHKSDQSPAVVLKLSELLSYMLYDCNTSEVPLQKEIEFMRNYIGLEQLRYGDRLDVSVNISGDYRNMLIAPLLLIPFLENAFKHGTSEQLEQAWMHIDLSVQGMLLKFKVINSREVTLNDDKNIGGIGLQNVKKRLQLLYPEHHTLRIVANDETFMITLTIELLAVKKTVYLPTNQLSEVVEYDTL